MRASFRILEKQKEHLLRKQMLNGILMLIFLKVELVSTANFPCCQHQSRTNRVVDYIELRGILWQSKAEGKANP